MRRNVWMILALAGLFAGCADETADYDPSWGTEQAAPGGKADLLDHAPLLTFDEPGTGSVTQQHMDIFKAELTRGDKIELRKTVTSGDLAPDFTLYLGATSPMRSTSYDAQPEKLTKTYEITDSGTYMIAVRAYQNRGAGDYKLELICTGGTCDGEPIPPAAPDEMWSGDVEDCVFSARRCAIDALPGYNGRVGAATATQIFDGCLTELVTSDDLSCARACEFSDDVNDFCTSVKNSLPDLADKSQECLSTLESCMDDCTDYDYSYGDDFYDTEGAMCWDGGLNGNCQYYAEQMPECGGTLVNETAQCYAHCESTVGALVDDLDTMCSDECGDCGIACQRAREGELWTSIPSDGLVGDVLDTTTFEIPDVCAVTIRVDRDGDGELPAGVYGLMSPSDDCDWRGIFEAGHSLHVPMAELTEEAPDDISGQERFGWLEASEDAVKWFRYSGNGADYLDI